MHSLPYPTASCTMCYRMTHNTYLVTMAFKAKCITTISFLLRCRRLTLTQCFAKYDLRLIPESPQCTVLYYELPNFLVYHSSPMRMFGFFCDLSLTFFIPPINIWKICIDLRLFSKCFTVPFLRPLRFKVDRCWILRLWPWNFVIVSESLAANLEKER